MKKIIATILALTLLALCLAACGDKSDTDSGGGAGSSGGGVAAAGLSGKDVFHEKMQIAFIPMSTAGQVTSIVQQAADTIMDTYDTVTINFFDAGFNPNTQITLINECITQGYDAIVMECADSTVVGPVISEAEAAGIPVITFNLGAEPVHTLHVKCDSYSGGWVSAEAMIAKLGGKGNVILLDVPAWQTASTTFCKGFEDYMDSYPDMNLLEYMNLPGNAQEDAYNAMRDLLTKYDHIDGVYAPDDNYALGVLQAINEAGRTGDGILVWGTDLQPGGIDAILAGDLGGSSWSDRYIAMYTAFSCAMYYAQTGVNSHSLGLTETPSIYVNFVAITQDNIKNLLPLTRWPGYQ